MPYANLPARICPRCGTEFKPTRWPNQVYCSRTCATTVRNQASRKELDERQCVQCGTVFLVESWKKKKVCSQACASRLRWAGHEPGPKKRSPAHTPERRRAYYAANKERIKVRVASYRSDPAVRERHNADIRRRRQENLDQARKRERERTARSYANALKAQIGSCQRCGYDRYLGAMDWHHLDPAQKVPGDLRNKPRDIVEQELAQCVLLCVRCHRELHGGLWTIGELAHEDHQSRDGDGSGPSPTPPQG